MGDAKPDAITIAPPVALAAVREWQEETARSYHTGTELNDAVSEQLLDALGHGNATVLNASRVIPLLRALDAYRSLYCSERMPTGFGEVCHQFDVLLADADWKALAESVELAE